jgi:CRP-like cAMP-binding protein
VIFLHFDARDIDDVLKKMAVIKFADKDEIYHNKKIADSLFIVLEGECSMTKGSSSIGKALKGDMVGDDDIAGDCHRSHTLIACAPYCKLAKLLKSDYDEIKEECMRKSASSSSKGLRDTILFKSFPNDIIRRLEGISTVHTYEKGEIVIQQETKLDSFYVIQRGLVSEMCEIDGKEHVVTRLEDYDYFGEECIVGGASLTTVIAVKKSVIIQIPYVSLKNLLRDDIRGVNILAAKRKIDEIDRIHSQCKEATSTAQEAEVKAAERARASSIVVESIPVATPIRRPSPLVNSSWIAIDNSNKHPPTVEDGNFMQKMFSFFGGFGALMCVEAKNEDTDLDYLYDIDHLYTLSEPVTEMTI